MEESVFTNNKRRTEVDRISGLPDSLLLHILSFLPPKYVVATSLLSKRWRPLWRSLPTLDFNPKNFRHLKFFVQFVDKMLKLVDMKSVKKFVLDYAGCKPPRKTSKWIDAVISSKIEHLEIHMGWGAAYQLPSSVFIAKNIMVLKLSIVRVVDTLSHVNLPLLEVLHLKDVKFSDFTSLEMLLNACPLLKDLVVRDMHVVDFRPLKIGRLNHLVTGDLLPQSLIPLEALSNVKCLRLCQYSKQDICPFNHDIPIFYNLTHLQCVTDEWTKMVNCLRNFPKLQNLVIKQLGSSSHPEPILDVPPCVSSHLKEFILLCFKGSDSESEMTKFMMKNARVLRTIYLCAGSMEHKLPRFKKFASFLRSGSESESCSRMHEGPLVFIVS